MDIQILNVGASYAEILLSLGACGLLMAGVYWRAVNSIYICIALLVVAAGLIFAAGFSATQSAYMNMFINDPQARVMKIAICLFSALALLYGHSYNRARGLAKNEYYVLSLFAVVGMCIIASGGNLLSLYLGLELMSLCLYAMIAFHRDNKLSVEAAMKYFVLGALASAILLYGMSLLYGLSGSLELSVIRAGLVVDDPAYALAVVFVIIAVAFKLGAVPLHMWVPDVYHGAPTSTTAFISAAPKIAALALLIRLLVDGLQYGFEIYQPMLIILAVLSVALGNIIAIAQRNIKRMLAYSAIAHMGFALLAAGASDYGASLFYVFVYAFMSVAAFGIILSLTAKNFESDELNDFKGIASRAPLLGLLILVLMFSLAGIPPTVGFFAKLVVIQALVSADLLAVAVVAVLLAVVGAFYYLRVIKLVYFDAPENDARIEIPKGMFLLLAINIISLLLILPWLDTLVSLSVGVVKGL